MEKKQAHTPGPWEVSGYHKAILQNKRSIDGCKICIAELPHGSYPGGMVGYNEANARLIAAAPDMAEALSELVAEFETTADKELERVMGPGVINNGYNDTGGIVLARAALKKAGA